jgi:hypothetical protein
MKSFFSSFLRSLSLSLSLSVLKYLLIWYYYTRKSFN